MSIPLIQSDLPLSDPRVLALRDRLRGGAVQSAAEARLDVAGAVRQIITDVQARGEQAVLDATRRLHYKAATLESLRVGPAQLKAAMDDPRVRPLLGLLERAAGNIRRYQESIKVQAPPPLRDRGRELGVRYTPLDRVAVYVPGGRALYPSSVLMTVVPAQVAGVRQIAMVSVPNAQGRLDPMVAGLAGLLGVGEVWSAAGVAALAALAIGTGRFAKVDKIVGPGSAFIAEAKRQLFGRVGIDSIAGPSEVLIIADASARPDWVAADLLAQAEHDPGSAILVTDSAKLAAAVAQELDVQAARLERSAAIRAGLEANSAIIVVNDLGAAADVANEFAPEHLQIVVADEQAVLAKVRHAGAIFLGAASPVPLGDYYAGPSHVLPTGGTARFSSPLSVNDFLKASSIIRYDLAALKEDAPDVIDFASAEGLTAHANAIRLRQEP
jgi:histidinol dehydrogenase